MRFHYQDLNNTRPKKLLYGRCWLGDFAVEWAIPGIGSFHLGIELGTGEGTAIGLMIAPWLFFLHLNYSNWKIYQAIRDAVKRPDETYGDGREIGIAIVEEYIWVDLWKDPMMSKSVDPWWWHISINLADILLGKVRYEKVAVDAGECEIDMPEGRYPATFKLVHQTWRRPRWPFVRRQKSVWFEIPYGLPFEGKGENSWDIGMDATFGTGQPYDGEHIHTLCDRVALSNLEERQKHGRLSDASYLKWFEQQKARKAQS